MAINKHLSTFAGRSVVRFEPERGLGEAPGDVAWRLGPHLARWDRTKSEQVNYGGLDHLELLLAARGVEQVRALVIGAWVEDLTDESSVRIAARLMESAARLPALEALFFGDIAYWESEISWIRQSDLGPMLNALPGLRVFGVRGGTDLRLSGVRHPRLERLLVESGGLSRGLVQDLAGAHLPALSDLELWLGSEWYGGNTHPEDLMPILSGKAFPSLKRLALKNSDIADDIARALVTAPVLANLERVDLSMGTLSDEGAEGFLSIAGALSGLEELDLMENYISKEMGQRLKAELPCPVSVWTDKEVDEYDEDRYVTIGE